MSDNQSPSPDGANPVQDWAQKNPWSALVVTILGMLLFSISSSFVTTKAVSGKESTSVISTENFATKQDKDEIWRYMNSRDQARDTQLTEIRSNMATKDELKGLRDLVNAQNDKSDTQIKMLQEQQKLLQEFIRLTGK